MKQAASATTLVGRWEMTCEEHLQHVLADTFYLDQLASNLSGIMA